MRIMQTVTATDQIIECPICHDETTVDFDVIFINENGVTEATTESPAYSILHDCKPTK